MREVTIGGHDEEIDGQTVRVGGRTLTVAASPLTLYIYTREFGPKADLLGDLLTIDAFEKGHPEDARFLSLYKILWAMCKTAKLGGEFPGFEEWLAAHDDLDLADKVMWGVVLEEATRGLFRRTTGSPIQRRA